MPGSSFSFQNLLEVPDLAGKGVGSGAVGRESSGEEGLGYGARACTWVHL